MIQPPRWAETYIGVPFVDKGRSRGGCDCWGLVRMVMLEQRGVELQAYDTVSERDYANVEGAICGAQVSGEWRLVVGQPQQFDVAEMVLPVTTSAGWRFLPLHVGIAIGGGWLLHTERATGAVLGHLASDPRLASRVRAWWRNRSLER